jgi:predicted Zn-dependent protease
MEMEADHIGLMLLAATGYDPRIAPKVYEKLGNITGDSALSNYLSTHPSSKTRSELLSRAHVTDVMDEAMEVYRNAITGSLTEGNPYTGHYITIHMGDRDEYRERELFAMLLCRSDRSCWNQ